MKKLFTFCCFVVFYTLSFSQFCGVGNKSKWIEKAYTNPVVVFKSSNQDYNSVMEKTMKELWAISPFVFRSINNNSHILSEDSSYLMLSFLEKTTTYSSSNGSTRSYTKIYHNFALMMSENTSIRKTSYNSMISYSPIDYYGKEGFLPKRNLYFSNTKVKDIGSRDIHDFLYRMPIILYNIQNALFLIKEYNLTGNSPTIVSSLNNLYRKNSGLLKKKILLIDKSREKMLTSEEWKKNYPYPFEYCDKSKIQHAIKQRDNKYAIFIPQITVNKTLMIYDAETYVPLYGFSTLQGLKINKKNVKQIASAIKKSNVKEISIKYMPLKKEEKTPIISNYNSEEVAVDSFVNPNKEALNSTPIKKTINKANENDVKKYIYLREKFKDNKKNTSLSRKKAIKKSSSQFNNNSKQKTTAEEDFKTLFE